MAEIEDYSYLTLTLHDAMLQDSTLLDGFVMRTATRTTEFKEVFVAMWDIYEISGETIAQFKRFINDRFALYKHYYEEMLDAYDKEIDIDDGIKTTTKSDGKHYDLPNKTTSSVTGYLTSDDTDDVVTTGGVNVIDQKRKAMALVRNIYEEFARKFSPCFCEIYGVMK